jgi:hypothetical protein
MYSKTQGEMMMSPRAKTPSMTEVFATILQSQQELVERVKAIQGNGVEPDKDKSEVERLRAENAALRQNSQVRGGQTLGLGMKVHPSGVVSVYGIGRNPVSLYRNQWLMLLERVGEIANFLEVNREHPDILEADRKHQEEKERRNAGVR